MELKITTKFYVQLVILNLFFMTLMKRIYVYLMNGSKD